MYAHVIEISVDRVVKSLPQVWRWPDRTVTTGFPNASASLHRLAGWYPIDDQRPDLEEGERWGPPLYTITEDEVICTAEVLPALPLQPTLEEIVSDLEQMSETVDLLVVALLEG